LHSLSLVCRFPQKPHRLFGDYKRLDPRKWSHLASRSATPREMASGLSTIRFEIPIVESAVYKLFRNSAIFLFGTDLLFSQRKCAILPVGNQNGGASLIL
jgi:hypothetical protein